jgi:hypothetical protein
MNRDGNAVIEQLIENKVKTHGRVINEQDQTGKKV